VEVAGELGDGALGADVVDQGLAVGSGGDERRGGGVVEGSGQAVGHAMEAGTASSAKRGSVRPTRARW
jgi:hypothetical protein